MGQLLPRHFSVDLDASPPVVESVAAPPEFGSARPPVDFPYRVSPTDPAVFLIVAGPSKCDCTWRANLEWVYQGKKGSTVIDDNGQPFRTVSPSKSVDYFPEFDRG